MSLIYRRSTLDDLCRHRRALAPDYGEDAALLARLPDVWWELLETGTLIAATVEDRAAPRDSPVLALGASVFVSDAFAAELQADLPPCPGEQIARRILAGRSPVLGPEALRRANAGEGATLCILHDGCPGVMPGETPDWAVKEKLVEGFFYYHRGYRIRQYLQQVRGPWFRDWMIASGMRLRRDYAEFYAARPGCRPAPEAHPYLLGATRAEVRDTPGVRAYTMFIDTRPRFGFTAREQALLRRALTGETDEESAAALGLSLSTVKKRWVGLYDRVTGVDPDLLGLEDAVGEPGRRGAERRRHLLNYLRDHPEELHIPGAPR